MLKISISLDEEWDEEKEEFVIHPPKELELEHSLVSLSKWESYYHKPFLDSMNKKLITSEEWLTYIRFMMLNEEDEEILYYLNEKHVQGIIDYINDPMTATWFSDKSGTKRKTGVSRSSSVVTSEIVYYWMISLGIPFECQYWHLNRLLTFIKVCSEKNQPAKKMSKRETMAHNRALNEARRKALNSKG